MRAVFMGTPAVAVPSLQAVADAFDVAAVYTRPDKPRGRGRTVEASEVKLAAMQRSLEVVQPRRLREEAERLRGFEPDVIAVVAYGAILPPDVLAVPRLGCVNVHFSLLPRWRGAAPVERAVLEGDTQTGVTTMLMDEGLDTGQMLLQEIVDIAPDDTTGSLRTKLADLGALLLVRTLFELGSLKRKPQPEDGVTYAHKVEPQEAELDPALPAVVLERKVRAFDPAPGAYVTLRDKRLKVLRAAVEDGAGEAGVIVEGPALQTRDGRLRLIEVRPEGKRAMSGADFERGYRPVGERITSRRG